MSKVPRRESPWGMPEGDNREPKAHRCNDRAEDVIQVLVLWFSIIFFLPECWFLGSKGLIIYIISLFS